MALTRIPNHPQMFPSLRLEIGGGPMLRLFPCLLLCGAGLFASAPAEEASFEFFSHTGKDLFPSAIISTATVDWTEGEEEEEEDDSAIPLLGDPNGWIGVALSDVPAGAEVEVRMSGDGWLKPSKFVGKAVDEEGGEISGDIDIIPKAAWDFDALYRVREQKPVVLTIQVSIDGEPLPEQNETLILRSLNDCPFYVFHGDEEEIEDMSWCFAAYVNENHPWIDGLLKEALENTKDADGKALIDGFTGYQSGDQEVVLQQVFAIWQALQRRGIKYSDISTTPPSKKVVSQTVRMLDQSVEATQANCVDGSVLMASILMKIGLKVHLVMVPGHCFLAFDGDSEGETLIGLETTLLGSDDLKSVQELKKLADKAEDGKIDLRKFKAMVAEEGEASMKTFLNAMETGIASLDEHAEAFDSGEDPDTQIISIRDAREFGIMPLASGKDPE